MIKVQGYNVIGKVNSSATLGGKASIGSYPTYHGDYEIDPSFTDDITLETTNKRMADDVTIFKVPYHEEENEFGTTCVIGG